MRHFWWHSNQKTRLTIAILGVLIGLAATTAVAFDDHGVPDERQRDGSAANTQRGDTFEVTVHSVSGVDSFEGMETATGNFLRASVAGLRRATGCWEAESLAAAQDLLRGKQVRLSAQRADSPAPDRTLVDVVLPDGKDYAHVAVEDGVALADAVTRRELAAVESTARAQRRGVWSTSCVPLQSTTTSSGPAPSSTTTTTTATPPPSQAPPPSPTTTTTHQRPTDDVQRDVRVGDPCSPEGARGKTSGGNNVVCARKGEDGQLKWRKKDGNGDG